MDRDSLLERARASILSAVVRIKPYFPHHVSAIIDQLVRDGTSTDRFRPTLDHWNRVRQVIAALGALPGAALPLEVRHLRLDFLGPCGRVADGASMALWDRDRLRPLRDALEDLSG